MLRLDSPLGLEVQRILAEHVDGLKKAVLLKQLRERQPFIQESHLDEILAHRDVFIERPGGVWMLARLLPKEEAPEQVQPAEVPSVFALPEPLPIPSLPLDLSTYVVFDLETSGFNCQTDGIIQFAALKIVDGRLTAGRNLFVRPVKPLPLSLQQKLRLDTHPEKLKAIESAPPIEEQIEHIAAFLGDLPLVAHNGRFDYAFLHQAYKSHLGRELTNSLLDTMELSLLTLPGIASYKLEDLGRELGIDYQTVASAFPPVILREMELDLADASLQQSLQTYLVVTQRGSKITDSLQASRCSSVANRSSAILPTGER